MGGMVYEVVDASGHCLRGFEVARKLGLRVMRTTVVRLKGRPEAREARTARLPEERLSVVFIRILRICAIEHQFTWRLLLCGHAKACPDYMPIAGCRRRKSFREMI